MTMMASNMRKPWLNAAIAASLVVGLAGCANVGTTPPAAPADITINGTDLYSESITSDKAGNIYTGSLPGTIFRAAPGSQVAEPWIEPDDHNGLLSVYGVLADDVHGLLWTCSNPNSFDPEAKNGRTSLKIFDLASGLYSGNYDFPEGPQVCNDIAIGPDGSIFASETRGGQIFQLKPKANELTLFAAGEELVGIDGLAFAEDGTLYINNVRQNLVQRVERDTAGAYAGLTTLELSLPISAPDGIRPLGGNHFIQSEGRGGRIAMISVDGDSAKVTPLFEGVQSAPGTTSVGSTGYAIEGKIQYLIDPELQGQDPGPFMLRAFTFDLPD